MWESDVDWLPTAHRWYGKAKRFTWVFQLNTLRYSDADSFARLTGFQGFVDIEDFIDMQQGDSVFVLGPIGVPARAGSISSLAFAQHPGRIWVSLQ